MKYMGSKNRHAKELLPIILKDRKPGQWYVEPFVGGCNMIDKVVGNRIGSDSHYYLVMMLTGLQSGFIPPNLITETEYNHIRTNKHNYAPELVGYVGFNLSYGGKFFGGYRRDKKGDYSIDNMMQQSQQAKRVILKQIPSIKEVSFHHCEYSRLSIPDNSIIYADPPYANTTKYKSDFDTPLFFEWCRQKVNEGHSVFISEYAAPDDFVCVWEKKVNNTLVQNTGSKQGVERLFIHQSQLNTI
jgi:DNA adenine methylase